ncbi:MAG: hypothetical protein MUF72_05925 [Elainella sp. Prado103]|jgi:hypothetical protein|nr:hypothetical protein [Elainella sp. Prado103]
MKRSGALLYLLVLFLSCGLTGWLLAAFQVPWPIWLGTLAVMLHLIRSGTAAIPLSTGWVVILISLAAILKAWAPVWNSQVPYQQAQLWAKGLLGIWLGAIGLVVLLSQANRCFTAWGGQSRRAKWMLVLLVWGALGLGGVLY